MPSLSTKNSAADSDLLRERAVRLCKIKLRPILTARIAHFEPFLPSGHIRIQKVSVRAQKTRWGSCSTSGTLSFNWKLYLAPPEVLDYVVVHELCHLVEMNHSPRFWALVEQIMPDYKERSNWLKINGHLLEINEEGKALPIPSYHLQ